MPRGLVSRPSRGMHAPDTTSAPTGGSACDLGPHPGPRYRPRIATTHRLASGQAARSATLASASSDMAPARVLVIDDSPTILKVVSAILSRHGYEPALARDGLAGIEM